jgi:hypothetical protein
VGLGGRKLEWMKTGKRERRKRTEGAGDQGKEGEGERGRGDAREQGEFQHSLQLSSRIQGVQRGC